jgi:uracil phosphoribosyltransferase
VGKLILCNHPMIQHKLSLIRDERTETREFRTLLRDVSTFMAYELTRGFQMVTLKLKTPVASIDASILPSMDIILIPILRAGLGMVEGVMELLPDAKVGHIGLSRDHHTLENHQYFYKVPLYHPHSSVILLDPMLATGGSANNAVSILKEKGYDRLTLISLIASPQGLKAVQNKHPDLDIYLASIDHDLNEQGYIIPGLGDAGDRLYGTMES